MNDRLHPLPDREQILLLEPFQGLALADIRVVETRADAEAAAAALMASAVVGFDTESKPTFAKNEISGGPHVVQFATREGTVVQFRDGMGTNPPAYREGDPVSVRYFLTEPKGTATIDRGMADWLPPGILCVMGSLLAGAALWARLGAHDD